jgi:hypothetical protein
MKTKTVGQMAYRKDVGVYSGNKLPFIAGMATMEGREEACADAIKSLMYQMDLIFVYCNPRTKYNEIADRLSRAVGDGCPVIFIDSQMGDLTDSGKFAWFFPEVMETVEDHGLGRDESGCIYFSCDDDLIYPPSYASFLAEGLRRHGGVVGVHGKVIRTPITSYYRDRSKIIWYHHNQALGQDMSVNCLGTGCLAFRSASLDLNLVDFPHVLPCMADVHFALVCQRDYVHMKCLAHRAGLLTLSEEVDHMHNSIWANKRSSDADVTARVNSGGFWALYESPYSKGV